MSSRVPDQEFDFSAIDEISRQMVFERFSLKMLVQISLQSSELEARVKALKMSATVLEIKMEEETTTIKVKTSKNKRLLWILSHAASDSFGSLDRGNEHREMTALHVDDETLLDKSFRDDVIDTYVSRYVLQSLLTFIEQKLRGLFVEVLQFRVVVACSVDLFDTFWQEQKEIDQVELVGQWKSNRGFHIIGHIKMGTFVFGCGTKCFQRIDLTHLNTDVFHILTPTDVGWESTIEYRHRSARIIRVDIGNRFTPLDVSDFFEEWIKRLDMYSRLKKFTIQFSGQIDITDLTDIDPMPQTWDRSIRSGWYCEKDQNGRIITVKDCREGFDIRRRDGTLGTIMIERVDDCFEVSLLVWTEEQKQCKISKEEATRLGAEASIDERRLEESVDRSVALKLETFQRLRSAETENKRRESERKAAEKEVEQLRRQVMSFDQFLSKC